MKAMRLRRALISAVTVWALSPFTPSSAAAEREIDRVLGRLLAPPAIKTQPEFSARLLVPPGQLYDPLYMTPYGDGVLLADVGGQEGERGGRLMSISATGEVRVLLGADRLLPIFAVDVAPRTFGGFGGQIFALAQAYSGYAGAFENHQILRIDPAAGYAVHPVCTLATTGKANKGVSGWGADAQFGPQGSSFADRFFAVTAYNGVIHQLTADGRCTPFVEIPPPYGAPLSFTFGEGNLSMLVTAAAGIAGTAPRAGEGAVLRVRADRGVDPNPVVTGLTVPSGIAVAPYQFGAFGGELFIADLGSVQVPVQMTQPELDDGAIYRAGADGKLHLVAKGLRNPMALRFVGNRLLVADIAGDFLGGTRELPDGFIAEILPAAR